MIDHEDYQQAPESASMVAQTAKALGRLSMAAADGDYIGAEADLLKTLGVSRPTLRQAAKVVENDRLLTVRRGAGGGFYAARPTARDAIQAPAQWLRLQSATLDQMSNASRLIFPQAAFQAAACDDAALIAELRGLRRDLDNRRPDKDVRNETVMTEVRLSELIARMTGDPVMQLFVGISHSFGLLERRLNLYRDDVARRLRWLELQRRLCDAVLAGDAGLARTVAVERGDLVSTWIRASIEAARDDA
ncbi:MAG: hypothetical protein ABW039_04095 [Sphingobium sp.]